MRFCEGFTQRPEANREMIRSVKVLYSSGLISKEKYKSIPLNLTTSIGTANKKRFSLKFMEGTRLPKILPVYQGS